MCNPHITFVLLLLRFMKIEPGDPVILFSGPNNIYFSQIPKEDQKIPNKQSEANVKNKRLIHNKKGIFDLASCIGKFYGQKVLKHFFYCSIQLYTTILVLTITLFVVYPSPLKILIYIVILRVSL